MKHRKLEDVLKEKFSQLELEEHPGSWDKISKGLQKGSRTPLSFYYAMAASFAGLLIAVGLFLYFQKDPSREMARQSTPQVKKETEVKRQEEEVIIEKPAIAEKPAPTSGSQGLKQEEVHPFVFLSSQNKMQQSLPDSSMVFVNRNSTVAYKITGQHRDVVLKGEAYFKVKKDQSAPFKIICGNGWVEVVGTAFNVHILHEDSVELVVEEGKVKFGRQSQPGQFIYLVAGEKGIMTKTGVQKVSNYHPNELAWKTGIISFQGTKMSSAIKVLEDYFNVKIRVSDPGVLNCHVTAKFKHPDLNKVLDLFGSLIQINYEKDNNGYILTGKGCD